MEIDGIKEIEILGKMQKMGKFKKTLVRIFHDNKILIIIVKLPKVLSTH